MKCIQVEEWAKIGQVSKLENAVYQGEYIKVISESGLIIT